MPSAFEWLVPGLIREKVAQLFKALPKRLRRHAGSAVPQHVTAFLTECEETRDERRETGKRWPKRAGAVRRSARRGSRYPADVVGRTRTCRRIL